MRRPQLAAAALALVLTSSTMTTCCCASASLETTPSLASTSSTTETGISSSEAFSSLDEMEKLAFAALFKRSNPAARTVVATQPQSRSAQARRFVRRQRRSHSSALSKRGQDALTQQDDEPDREQGQELDPLLLAVHDDEDDGTDGDFNFDFENDSGPLAPAFKEAQDNDDEAMSLVQLVRRQSDPAAGSDTAAAGAGGDGSASTADSGGSGTETSAANDNGSADTTAGTGSGSTDNNSGNAATSDSNNNGAGATDSQATGTDNAATQDAATSNNDNAATSQDAATSASQPQTTNIAQTSAQDSAATDVAQSTATTTGASTITRTGTAWTQTDSAAVSDAASRSSASASSAAASDGSAPDSSVVLVTYTSVITNADGSVSTNTGVSSSALPTNLANADSSDGGISSTGKTLAIVGGVIGGVVLIGAIVFIVWKLSQRRFADLDDTVNEIKWPELNPDGQTVSSHAATLNPLATRRTGGAGIEMKGDGTDSEWDDAASVNRFAAVSSGDVVYGGPGAGASYNYMPVGYGASPSMPRPPQYYDPFLGASGAPQPLPADESADMSETVYPPVPGGSPSASRHSPNSSFGGHGTPTMQRASSSSSLYGAAHSRSGSQLTLAGLVNSSNNASEELSRGSSPSRQGHYAGGAQLPPGAMSPQLPSGRTSRASSPHRFL